jgi:hypothetical protein
MTGRSIRDLMIHPHVTGETAVLKSALSSTLILAACILVALPAQAQPIRTFVALTGSDSNPCTFSSPCKSVQHAHDVAAAGGEIRMLDPGSFGLLTITKSISILGDGHGGMAASGGATAITINAGASDVINLRGIVLEGFGGGNIGIVFNSGAFLNIQDSQIRNFAQDGIDFVPSAASRLLVSNTVISDNGHQGVHIAPVGTGAVSAFFDHVAIANYADFGLSADAGGADLDVDISESVIMGGGSLNATGVDAAASAGQCNVMIRDSTISDNFIGLQSSGANTVMRLTGSTMTKNFFLLFVTSGQIVSFGDNSIAGNGMEGALSSTTIPLR